MFLGCAAKEPSPIGSRAAMSGSSSSNVEPQIAVRSSNANAGHGPLTLPKADNDEDAATADQCAKAEYEAKLRPLDMLVLLDQSGSMTEHDDRWTPTTNAIKSFVRAPESAGIGVGLQYFPLGKNDDDKCVGATYVKPSVPVAPLPGNAQAMIQSIDAHYFTKSNCCDAPEHKGTPTRPALEGVFEYLRGWLAQHPERDAVVLLATDGEPSCNARRLVHRRRDAAHPVVS
jgi:hypothetical protein